MSKLRLYLFGTPRIERDGQVVKIDRRKAIALIAYLALTEQQQSRDVLAALLWSESDHTQARAALRSTLSTLTKITDFQWIVADRTTISLNHEALWVDVIAFKTLLKEITAHGHHSDVVCDQCLDAYKEANRLYQADFLHGFYIADNTQYEEWQLQQREWLRREYIDIQRRLSLYFSERQQSEQAIAYALQWLMCDPLQENAHRQLMRLYATNGQRTEALRQYGHCVDRLDSELATPPESETTQLYQAILQNTMLPTAHITPENSHPIGVMPPLPALVIGRQETLQEIKRRLGLHGDPARPVTVIHGWPGVGKSTTVAMMTHDSEIARHFPDGILWASLGETPDLLNELSGWANALGLGDSSQVRKIEDVSTQITAVIRDKRMLLVIDDVWQVEHIKPFRVGGQHCATVMTSRLLDVAIALSPTSADVYRLPVLSEAASLELLSELSPETVSQYPEEARELVHDLEGLPLAIHVAGRLLQTESSMGWGVKELLSELRTGANLLTAQAPTDMLVVGRDASPTVAALLNRSTDMLDAETRLHFALLGLFVPKPATFHLEAMAVAWDLDDPRPIARRLVSHGLLEPVSGGRFQMHALLVMHAQTLLNAQFGVG